MTPPGRLTEPKEFENIIVRAHGRRARSSAVSDIGRVELGARDYSLASRLNGKTAATIGVYQRPGANALDVARRRARGWTS